MNRNYLIFSILAIAIVSIGWMIFGGKETTITTTQEPAETGDLFPTGDTVKTTQETRRSGTQTSQTETGAGTTEVSTPAAASSFAQVIFSEVKQGINKETAGGIVIERPFVVGSKEKVGYLRYIERGNGHISDIAMHENAPAKISNLTTTGIFDVFWGKGGNTFVMRRLEGINNTVQTIYASLSVSSASTTEPQGAVMKLSGTILPSNVKEIAVSPDKSKIFYLLVNSGASAGIISDFKTGAPSDKKTQVFSSEISEWQVGWPSTNIISLTTKPSGGVAGFLYFLDITKPNKLKAILSNKNGMTALISPNAKGVIYSESFGSQFATNFYDIANDKTASFAVKTLPEKCVWTADSALVYCAVPRIVLSSSYPDNWYQGLISFTDDLWAIEAKTLSAKQIAKLGDVDAINLTISEGGNYLSFTNKKDGTPWFLKVGNK